MGTMQESITEYIASLSKQPVSRNTVVSYERDLRKMAGYFSADQAREKISDSRFLTETHLRTYLYQMEQEQKRPATIARAIAAMKAYFRYLQQNGGITENPASRLKAPKIEREKPTILTPEETVLLLKQPDGKTEKSIRDRAMLELMYATGIRVSELVQLKVSDVNLAMEYILCSQGGKERVIPFGNTAKQSLEDYLSKVRPLLVKEEGCDLLFTNLFGKQMSRQGFYKMIKKYAGEAGIAAEITPHTLRHSFAAHLVNNGADLYAVQEMMGYADLSAAQIYAQMRRASVREEYKKTHPRN